VIDGWGTGEAAAGKRPALCQHRQPIDPAVGPRYAIATFIAATKPADSAVADAGGTSETCHQPKSDPPLSR